MKWKWEARAKHWGDFNRIARSLGFLDEKNRVRLWDGKKFFPLFELDGHTQADFDSCECGMFLPEEGCGSNIGKRG